jgi:hypothetical protein
LSFCVPTLRLYHSPLFLFCWTYVCTLCRCFFHWFSTPADQHLDSRSGRPLSKSPKMSPKFAFVCMYCLCVLLNGKNIYIAHSRWNSFLLHLKDRKTIGICILDNYTLDSPDAGHDMQKYKSIFFPNEKFCQLFFNKNLGRLYIDTIGKRTITRI